MKLTKPRIFARDRRLVAAHEAAHVAVASYCGINVQASVWFTDPADAWRDKAFLGRCVSHSPITDEAHRRLIGVAGAVGEVLCGGDSASDFIDEVHERMSPTDCELAGFPHWDDGVPWIAEDDDTFFGVVTEVETLLLGGLADDWRLIMRQLKRSAR